jgi:hypothetical protein
MDTEIQSSCSPIIQEANNTFNNKKSIKRHTKQNKTLKKAAVKGSCFSVDDLLKIAREWNMLNPRNKILLDVEHNKSNTLSSKTLWNLVAEKLSSQSCRSEYCWIKKKLSPHLSRKLLLNFRPEMPSSWHRNNTEWLSTSNIEDVMEQYELEFPNFTFRGAVPIDFDKKLDANSCVSNKVCDMNLRNLKKMNKNKIGIVFNLDEHTKSGSHWIAMFIDLDIMKLGFWDSYGFEPPAEVITLITRMQSQSKKYFKRPLEIVRNKKRHQYKNSECGMYCIYFISQLLEGQKFEQVYNTIITDDFMNQKRKMFFSIDK